jgi:uncharacterized membrane protein
MNPELIIFLLSMSPISELRGALPLGVMYYKLSLGKVIFLSITGNILITLILLILLNFCLEFFIKKIPFLRKIFNYFFEKTKLRHQKKFNQWKDLALVIIVALPLPFTGAWTGTLASYVFGITPRRAFPLIFLGIMIAGLIISLLTINGVYLLK